MKWLNFFTKDLYARGVSDHVDADKLSDLVASHDGTEAYHSAFDCIEERLKVEEDTGDLDDKGKRVYRYHAQTAETLRRWPRSFNRYDDVFRPAFGYVWFDFDSSDGGVSALEDARAFVKLAACDTAKTYYSGSKGFHVGIPLGAWGIEPSKKLGQVFNLIAHKLKASRFATLDTTVFNAQRKFRVLGSKHPKTGLFKIECDLANTLEAIKNAAKERGTPRLLPAPDVAPIPALVELAGAYESAVKDSVSLDEWKRYARTDGDAAFKECGFLKHCINNSTSLTEPEWYACASIVGRFQDGTEKFHNMSKPHPGYTRTAAQEKLDQALQASGPRTCKAINAMWGKCGECKHFEKIKSPVAIMDKDVISTEATGFYFLHTDDAGKVKKTPDYEGLLTAYKRDTKFFRDPYLERTYAWVGTHYEIVTETHINAWCEEKMNPSPPQKIVNEFRAKILRNELRTERELETTFFVTTQGKLNMRNGTLDIAKGEVYPHEVTNGFQYVLPYDFDPAAKAPTFEKFLDEVTLSRPELKQTLLEFLGYCLWPSYDDHCFLWLSGTGRNGKSTLLELVQALVGESNCSNVMLEQFEKPNYVQMLDHKLVNIGEESETIRIEPSMMGPLKALSSGARVPVDQKYERPYSMRTTAKLIFAANKPPVLPGSESAIKARMIVVPFDLQLEDHGETTNVSRIDWKLLDKMKAELPGILNLCLDALRNFVQRTPRKIHRSAISLTAMNEIVRDSDPIESWFQDYIEVLPSRDAGAGIQLASLYAHFKSVQSNPDKAMEAHWFARRLRSKLGNRCTVTQQLISGRRSQTYFGIKPLFGEEF